MGNDWNDRERIRREQEAQREADRIRREHEAQQRRQGGGKK